MKKVYKVTETKKNTFKKRPSVQFTTEDKVCLLILGTITLVVIARCLIG